MQNAIEIYAVNPTIYLDFVILLFYWVLIYYLALLKPDIDLLQEIEEKQVWREVTTMSVTLKQTL